VSKNSEIHDRSRYFTESHVNVAVSQEIKFNSVNCTLHSSAKSAPAPTTTPMLCLDTYRS